MKITTKMAPKFKPNPPCNRPRNGGPEGTSSDGSVPGIHGGVGGGGEQGPLGLDTTSSCDVKHFLGIGGKTIWSDHDWFFDKHFTGVPLCWD